MSSRPERARPAGSTSSRKGGAMADPITGPVSGTFSPTPAVPATPKQVDIFSSQGFLKILASQMTSQNPLEPMKDTEFIGQMAQFSQLEQTTTMAQSMK